MRSDIRSPRKANQLTCAAQFSTTVEHRDLRHCENCATPPVPRCVPAPGGGQRPRSLARLLTAKWRKSYRYLQCRLRDPFGFTISRSARPAERRSRGATSHFKHARSNRDSRTPSLSFSPRAFERLDFREYAAGASRDLAGPAGERHLESGSDRKISDILTRTSLQRICEEFWK